MYVIPQGFDFTELHEGSNFPHSIIFFVDGRIYDIAR